MGCCGQRYNPPRIPVVPASQPVVGTPGANTAAIPAPSVPSSGVRIQRPGYRVKRGIKIPG